MEGTFTLDHPHPVVGKMMVRRKFLYMNRFLGGLSRLKEMAPYISMQMVRSNENNIIYSNSMKTDYWDEIYPDDKTYIRPEDGKKFSIVNGVFYAVHPIYTLFVASEDGQIINIKHGSPISCRQHPDTDFILSICNPERA